MSTHRWPGVFLVVALLLQSAFPALAAPVPSRAAPSTALFPPWYRAAQADSLQRDPAAYAPTEVSLLGPAASRRPSPTGTSVSAQADTRRWLRAQRSDQASREADFQSTQQRGYVETTVVGTGAPVEITQSTPPGTVFERAIVLEDGGAAWFVGGLSPGQTG
ncbi:MAG: hypothetical protein N0A03_10405 [Anaerolineae bacterium]|nr:hypothetical protein [Anaerolineae bacterium]